MKRFLVVIGTVIFLLIVSVVVSLFSHARYFDEFELDENSFDAEAIELLEEASGIDVPAGSKGLRFLYIPPIDPIYFAKFEIPTTARSQMVEQIERLEDAENFSRYFANDRCSWWPNFFENTIISRRAAVGGFVEAHLIEEEDGRLILFIKYFTI